MDIDLYSETYTFQPEDLARLDAMEAELAPLVQLCSRGAPVKIQRDNSLRAPFPCGRAVVDILVQDEELSGFMMQLLRRIGFSVLRSEVAVAEGTRRRWMLSVLLLPTPKRHGG